MCPSLAELDSSGFPKSKVSNHEPQANKKFFDPAIFQKCWRGVGEQPTFAKQIILQSVFPAAIAIFKTSQFEISCFYETSCKFEQGNGAIAARWQAKAGVEPPFVGRERPFFLRTMIANHEPQANKKFFDPAIFQKCWRGVGEQPTFAKQIILQSVFPAAIAFLKLPNSELAALMKQVTNSDKATGQLQHAGRQKQGWNPLLPDAKNRFP